MEEEEEVIGVGEKEGLAMVTFRPALDACMAGELDRLWGEARPTLGDALLSEVIDGEGLAPAGDATDTGEWRIAGLLTLLLCCALKQYLTLSDPLCESLLLLGEPGEETITWTESEIDVGGAAAPLPCRGVPVAV